MKIPWPWTKGPAPVALEDVEDDPIVYTKPLVTGEPPPPAPKWWELERLIPYRDLVMVTGYLVITGGVAMWSVPACLVFAGSGIVALSWLLGRAA